MELGYWNVRGRAELLRVLLRYLHIDYKEVNPQSIEDAHAIFAKHHFIFPNLPYLVDGDNHVTESSAMWLYVLQKANRDDLRGHPGIEQIHHQEVLGVLGDIREALVKVVCRPKFQEKWEKTAKPLLRRKYRELSALLGDKDYLFGHLTFADFALWLSIRFTEVVLRALEVGVEDFWGEWKNLPQLAARIESFPELQEYFKSEEFRKRPYISDFLTKLKIGN